MSDHDYSAPPSPPPLAPHETGRHAAVPETTADRALRKAQAALDAIGKPPNAAIRGDTGTGMWALFYEAQSGLARVEQTCSAILARLDSDTERSKARNGWASWLAHEAARVLLVAAIGGVIAWLSGFHR